MKKKIIGILPAVLFLITIFVMSSSVAFARTALKITKQPVSVTVPTGSTANVTVSANGDGLTYKWYYKDKDDSEYSRAASSKGKTYSVKMNNSRNGRKVYCVIKDKYGKTVKTKTVTLTKGNSVKITKQPKSVVTPGGSTAKVTVSASGDGLTYKWYYKDKGDSKYARATSVKGKTYSVKMKKSRSGRKVYCVITDKYGNSVKTNTVTLTRGNPAKITKQPVSVTVNCGSKAKVTVSATGDGLTYKWYYKNSGASKFTRAKSVTGKTYSLKMNESRNGRKVYCVITDKYGNSVKTKTVTLSVKHVLDSGVVTRKATCTLAGEKVYTCKNCSFKKAETISKTAHSMGEWKVIREATVTAEGVERRSCSKCSYYNDRFVAKLKAVYFITVNTGVGEPLTVGVAENGKYTLETPEKVGYVFVGWKDEKGETFNSSGIISADVTVNAVWELDGTDTFAELTERTDAGVDRIVITADITVNKPIYISYETSIYSDGDYTLKRDPGYAGDIFVVGRDRNGDSAVVQQRKPVLNLGGGNGTLTIDGNKDNLNVKVVGSALFVSDSSVVNIYDGIKIVNNMKLGNDRVLDYIEPVASASLERAGGAAVLNLNATVNMYGGVIDNNIVATEHTVITDETGAQETQEFNGCGGSIYNRGNFNMHGGTISNSEALRGGGIYNDRIMYMFAGTVSDNLSHTYGGGVSSSSSSNADMHVGSEGEGETMLFSGNRSMRAGGAIYSNTSSPIIIYGNAQFVNNRTDSSGGAIYTAGPLTVKGAVFNGNSCEASGGAIYHHYTKADFNRRFLSLTDCVFENNSASLGGAVILSASNEVAGTGTYATITDCQFTENKAVKTVANNGNGGAIYITRSSEATIEGCTFEENSAALNAGAVAVQNGCNVKISKSSFTGNTAVYGGAVNAATGSVVDMSDIELRGNSAVADANGNYGNGGAAYIYGSTVTFNNVDFYENNAANHAGAVYLGACELKLDSTCEFDGNSAGNHGGAFYMTYKTNSDGTKYGSKLVADGVNFKNNTAQAGGVVSIRSACEATMNGAVLSDNSVSGTGNDASGGGAVYVGYGTLTLTDVTATGNTSAGYGGAINSVCATVTVTGGTFSNNSAPTGGAINAISASNVSLSGTTLKENESTYIQSGEYNTAMGGGAVKITGGSLNISGTTFDTNKTGYYGGAVLSSGAVVNIVDNSIIKGSTGSTGAAMHFSGKSTVTITDTDIIGNVAKSNGVVYMNNGTINMTNVTASDNEAYNGGVIYTSNAKTVFTVNSSTFIGNYASKGGVIYADSATVQFIGVEQSGNSAKNGGVLYSENGKITFDNGILKNNTVTKSGGAINTLGGSLEIKNTVLSSNEATGNGGAIYAYTTAVTLNDATFNLNKSGSNGGALDIVGSDVTATGDCRFTENTAVGHGGAVYTTYVNPEEEGAERIPGKLTMTDGSFSNNTAMGGGAISIRSGCEAIFDGTAFSANSVTGYAGENDGDGEGGGAVYVGFGKLTLTDVTATGNTASDFGGVVAAVKSTVTVNGGTFSENTALSGGVINAMTNSTVTVSGTTFTLNNSTATASDGSPGGGVISMAGGNLTVTGATMDLNTTGYYGAAIYAKKATVKIDGNSVVTNSTGSTGAALYFREGCNTTIENVTVFGNTAKGNGVIYANGGTLNMTNVTAMGNQAVNGGVLFVSGGNTKVTLKNSNWNNNTAKYGGAINMSNATVTITDSELKANTSNLGGAIYNSRGILEIVGVTFTDNKSTTIGDGTGNGGAITLSGGKLNATGANKFTGNSAEGHGGAVYVSYAKNDDETKVPGVMNMTGGLLENNSAIAGGAISSRTECEVTLTGTELKSNTASSKNSSEGGGAIFTNNNTLTLSGVVMDGNSAGYYGGAITALSATVTVKDNSHVINNSGITGVAFNFRSGTYTLSDIIVTNNIASANGSGVIYITGSGTMDITGLTASGNENNNGGVIYISGSATVTVDNSELKNNKAWSFGGAIDHRSSKTLTVTNTTISGNTAKNGGAINAVTGTVNIKNSQITGNSATEFGGAVNATGTTTVAISDNSALNNNTAASAGAVYLDQGATVTISDSTLEGNSATGGDGGAVVIADSSDEGTATTKLVMTNVTLKDNTASAKGGALSTDTASPNLIIDASGCTFIGNSTTGAGGGAVEIQNGNCNSATDPEEVKLVFTGCVFTNNSSKTTGGAVEIRTNSCAKFDGITATGNTAKQNGGVIYVTSNFSRLYLTGTVSVSDNTSTGGTFIHLWNSNYTNPPKIYTTHSSSADWYSQVGGNKTNVAFDLTTLP